MDRREQEVLLSDYGRRAARSQDPFLLIVEAALFVEQTFGLSLSDEDISIAKLGSPEALRSLVLDKEKES